MKKNNLKIVKIDKNKSLFNYEKKILINELILDLKLLDTKVYTQKILMPRFLLCLIVGIEDLIHL